MVSILLTYKHEATDFCDSSTALIMRVIDTEDGAYERPTLYCRKCHNQLQPMAVNGRLL